ncbi:hypothetical protein [Flavobacterium sp. C4GT6]|uniref:hypothetical protein n=1 Tax=Flavobacterium sp. C4GT6 TaxID=3103818 RepID=UPI002ED081A5
MKKQQTHLSFGKKKEYNESVFFSGKQFIPENLSWELLMSQKSIKFIGTTIMFGHYDYVKNIEYSYFLKLTKACFGDAHKGVICSEMLLPLKLIDSFFYVKQTIYAPKTYNEVIRLLFVNIYFKKQDGEPYEVLAKYDYKKTLKLTKEILQFLKFASRFSRWQLINIKCSKEGFISYQITLYQSKTKGTLYRFIRKILEKNSLFFDFSNVCETVEFYYKCFPKMNFV